MARGPVVALAHARAQRPAAGEPIRETGDLRQALLAAIGELRAMAEGADTDAAEMLEFQIALLEDDELSAPAFAAIAAGVAADTAWLAALDHEIAGYQQAADEYFQARAADILDIRDRVLSHLTGNAIVTTTIEGAILVADDLPPSRFLAIDWSAGGALVLTAGSPTSHVAMLARARGVPMVVGLGVPVAELHGHALLDAARGLLILDPGADTEHAFRERRDTELALLAQAERAAIGPCVNADGEPVSLLLNIADPAELDALDVRRFDGIGLVRTEFLFHAGAGLPDEDTQYRVYRRIAEWATGKPVTIRTLDAGGDKPIPGLTLDAETNPFLGVRGLRLSFARPDIFRIQLRALARAAVHGNLKIMLPMVTAPHEVDQARAMLEAEVAALAASGVAARLPPLGIMVEVPAAAIAADLFRADFFSIGSNDLTQYVAAAGRDAGALAELADAALPAVLRLMEHVVRVARERNIEVSLCGDAAGDPLLIPQLLATGLRALSMAAPRAARARLAIAATRTAG